MCFCIQNIFGSFELSYALFNCGIDYLSLCSSANILFGSRNLAIVLRPPMLIILLEPIEFGVDYYLLSLVVLIIVLVFCVVSHCFDPVLILV